jgi:hypothetical protein
MATRVQRDPNGGVPEALADDLGVDDGTQQLGRVRVPRSVEPDLEPLLGLEAPPDRVEARGPPGTTALPGQTAGRSQAAATMVLPRTLASYMA